jgi:hypothetical protein
MVGYLFLASMFFGGATVLAVPVVMYEKEVTSVLLDC